MTGAPGTTPGPWQHGFDDREGVVSVGPLSEVGDGNVICLPPDFRMEASHARWPANARQIAAAPELYSAGKALLDARDMLEVTPVHVSKTLFDERINAVVEAESALRAALARARGEQP